MLPRLENCPAWTAGDAASAISCLDTLVHCITARDSIKQAPSEALEGELPSVDDLEVAAAAAAAAMEALAVAPFGVAVASEASDEDSGTDVDEVRASRLTLVASLVPSCNFAKICRCS